MEKNKFVSPGVFTSEHSDNHGNPIKLPKLLIIGNMRHGLVTF